MKCRYCGKSIRRVDASKGHWYEALEGTRWWLDKVTCKVKAGLHDPIPETEIVTKILDSYGD